ncbi:hypothetical protein LCGC14_0561980 [marine sediment metagenome]|uniref:DRBM domain-containing protein n=1 Tax=marine sediment metagenome TaxID=412755 RepID=A0A0F9U894_9ZZZZ
MANTVSFTKPIRLSRDGKYVVEVFINGACFGSETGTTPAKAKAAAKRLLKNIGRRE